MSKNSNDPDLLPFLDESEEATEEFSHDHENSAATVVPFLPKTTPSNIRVGMQPEVVQEQQAQAKKREERRRLMAQSLLAIALEEQTPEFKNIVYDIMVHTGIDPNDPMLLMMVATGRLEAILEERPKEMSAMFDQWADLVHTRLESYREGLEHYERTAIKVQEKAIAQSVSTLIQRTSIEKFIKSLNAMSIGLGATIVLSALGLGFVLGNGWSTAQQAQIKYAPGKPQQLTLEEANALEWAMGPEGMFAKNFMDWNDDLLATTGGNRQCEADAKELGVTLEIAGRQAQSGFCVLWVKPPDQRQFQSNTQP